MRSTLSSLLCHGLAATLLALGLTAPHIAQARETVVEAHSMWRYLNVGEQAPAGWQTVGFDDSGWSEGQAQLGYGEGDENTLLVKGVPLTYRTNYFRTSFQVDDTSGVTGVVLDLLVDKGAVVHLNGAEVYRTNMQPRQLTRYEAFSVGDHEGWIDGIPIRLGALNPGTNVLAVEVHQNEPRAERLSFDARLEMVRAGEAEIVNGPWVTQVTETTARVMWETDAPTDSTVVYGLTSAYGVSEAGRNDTTLHSVTLERLSPGTQYHYQVEGSGGALSNDCTFTTVPQAGEPFSWLVYGDNRSSPGRHASVIDGAVAHDVDLVITTGDMVEAGQHWGQWQEQFFRPAAPLLERTGILPVVGNHDSEILHPGSHFWDYFPNGRSQNWYSIRYSDVELFIVDTSHAHGSASRQVAWLEDALASSTAPILVVAHHYPVFSSGKHGSDPFAVGALLPLYEAYGVSLVLNGHDHLYEHSEQNGVHYLLAGGGGAGLYNVNDSRNPAQVYGEKTHNFAIVSYDGQGTLNIKAYRPDNSLIETFTVSPNAAP